MPASKLPEDGDDYHNKVVGMKPTYEIPNPPEVLIEHIRYDLDKGEAPKDYVPLWKKKGGPGWSPIYDKWPSEVNIEIMRLLPPGDEHRCW